MKDCMLDLETLGRDADTVVLQIGLLRFDIETGEIDDEGLEVNIDILDSLRQGFKVDGSTIEWWFNQSNEARESVISKPKFPVKVALQKAAKYMKGCNTLWSHATFDAPILAYHFRKMMVKMPIHYRGHRDIRTLVHLAGLSKNEFEFYKLGKPGQDPGPRHTALADCRTQVEYCHECWKRIKT